MMMMKRIIPQILLVVLPIQGVLGADPAPSQFREVVALGDSMTDTGLTYKLSNHQLPPDGLGYFEGRFSNGRTWAEHFSEGLGADLKSYAYGKATTDAKVYPADPELNIPGCVQQANLYLATNPSLVEDRLISVGFFGNDFFNPEATARQSMANLFKCLRLVASTTNHLTLPIGFAPDRLPYFINLPVKAMVDGIKAKADEGNRILNDMIPRLKEEFPNLNIYPYHFGDFLKGLKSDGPTTLNTDGACINATPGDIQPSQLPLVCDDPTAFAFYDPVHPTAETHKKLAKFVLNSINRPAN